MPLRSARWAATLTMAALAAPAVLAGTACASPPSSRGIATPPTTRADTAVTPRAARPDGARPIELRNVRGSLQNSCWLGVGSLVLTQFAGGYNRGAARVSSVTLDGSYRGTVTDTPAHGVNMPAGCSHAGTVVYSADTESGDAIMAVALPGGRPRTVLHRPGRFAWEPTFSPDGRSVVFELHTDGDGPGELWVVGIDGTSPRRLTAGSDDRQPVWSPRGDAIVFQRHTPTGWKVWTADPQTGVAHAITASGAGIDDTDPSWSPDGRFVVYSSNDQGAELANLFAVPAAGGPPTRITRGDAYDGAPAWSPDSTTIAFESSPTDPDTSRTTLMVVPVPSALRNVSAR